VLEELTLAEAARICGAELEGDADAVVSSVAPLELATAGDLTFYDGRQDADLVSSTKAAAVVVPRTFPARASRGASLLRADGPQSAFLTLVRALWERRQAPPPGVAASASVHPEARLGDHVHLGESCTVGARAEIGAGAVLHPGVSIGAAASVGAGTVVQANATVGPGVRIGERCLIHAGAVIGFAYRPTGLSQGSGQAVSYGGVRIEDEVEIGPSSVVEDGEERPTTICRGAKLGAAVVVGHDCVIGPEAELVAMVGLAGGVHVGAQALLFGQVGVRGDARIGERAIVYAKSGVTGDVPPDSRYLGIPARPRDEAMEVLSALKALPSLAARVAELERAAQLDRNGSG
jgi:UDP-3-O-[3-hydroxymyristoyl] glucosamine N-acyltransferase